MITVTLESSTNAPDLGAAAGGQITLTPLKLDGSALAVSDIGNTSVGAFKCAPVSTAFGKYLPGSCK